MRKSSIRFHAYNNNMAALMEEAGAEMVIPGLTEFFLYCAYGGESNYRYLAGSRLNKAMGSFFILYIEHYHYDMRLALSGSDRFKAPATVDELAEKAGSSEVNQINHVTLMLEKAKESMRIT